jgi:hypothetical protein
MLGILEWLGMEDAYFGLTGTAWNGMGETAIGQTEWFGIEEVGSGLTGMT